MTNKLYDSNGVLVGNVTNIQLGMAGQMRVTLDTGHVLWLREESVHRDMQGDWRIRKVEESIYDALCYSTQAERMKEMLKKKEAATMSAASIKNVIFNPPATIVYWTDGNKTVVKCSANDIFDPEKGLAMAVAKRACGNNSRYYKEIRRWVEKSKINYPGASAPSNAPANKDILKTHVQKANNDLKAFMSAAMNGNNTELLFKIGALTADLAILEQELNK